MSNKATGIGTGTGTRTGIKTLSITDVRPPCLYMGLCLRLDNSTAPPPN